jgi:HSP20 family protein
MSQIIDQSKKHDLTTGRSQRVEYTIPAVNIHRNNEGFTIEVEMPGVDKQGIEITIENGTLTLMGHRSSVKAPGSLLHSEIHGRDYRRVFDLDPAIDPSQITASMKQGVLVINLPKADAAKPRKIPVA